MTFAVGLALITT